MKQEEIRELLNRPRALLLVDLGLTLLAKALENGPMINCGEFQMCYWCDIIYISDDKECKDHADGCVWPMVRELVTWREPGVSELVLWEEK